MRIRSAFIACSALAVVLVGVVLAPAPAGATAVSLVSGSVDEAAQQILGGEFVYVDPQAELALTPAQAAALTAQIAATGLPIFMAVLRSTAGSDPDAVLVTLKDAIAGGGIYVVVVGRSFRAGSTSGKASSLATDAFRDQKDNGLAAVLTEFVRLASKEFNADAQPASGDVALTMKVKNCEGCVISAYHTPGIGTGSIYTKKSTVRGGVATFVLPAAMTVGMSFDIRHKPSAGALGGGAVPVIGMGFKGVPTGTPLSREQTRQVGAKASWCWAGADPGAVTMNVSTYYVKPKNPPAWSGPLWMYAWASPTQGVYSKPGWRPAQALGHQDAPYC